MGAGATMGSCISRLPFHPKEGVGPKSITVTSEMAKHNSRVRNTCRHFLCTSHRRVVGVKQIYRQVISPHPRQMHRVDVCQLCTLTCDIEFSSPRHLVD